MRRILLPLVLALLFIGFASPSTAQEEGLVRLPLPDVLDHQDEWYGIYMHGTKSGYAHIWTRGVGEGEGSKLLYALEIRIELQAMGQAVVMEMSERSLFDGEAPYAFRTGRWRQSDPQNQQKIRVDVVDGRIEAVIEEAGGSRTIERDDLDYTFEDYWTPQTWLEGEPKVGDTIRVRAFDMSSVESDVDILEVTGQREMVAGGVLLTLYDLALASKRDGDQGTAVADARGHIVSTEISGLFELRLEDEAIAKQLEVGGDLFLLNTVAIDRPIGNAPEVRRLVVEVVGASDLQSGPRQSVERDSVTGKVILTLGQGVGSPLVATPESIQRSLEETVEYPIHHPAVKALARKAVGGAETPREKVARLVTFVGKYVEDQLLPSAPNVLGLIEKPQGDCTEHALLFTTLARSVGIPARAVGGLMYMGDEFKRFGGHAWSEVVLDGHWVQVDPAWEQMEIDATHVTLSREDDSTARQLQSQRDVKFLLKTVENAKTRKTSEALPPR